MFVLVLSPTINVPTGQLRVLQIHKFRRDYAIKQQEQVQVVMQPESTINTFSG